MAPDFNSYFASKIHRLFDGTDCGWWSLKPDAKPAAQFALMRELDLPDEVKTDIYSGNAKRLFGW